MKQIFSRRKKANEKHTAHTQHTPFYQWVNYWLVFKEKRTIKRTYMLPMILVMVLLCSWAMEMILMRHGLQRCTCTTYTTCCMGNKEWVIFLTLLFTTFKVKDSDGGRGRASRILLFCTKIKWIIERIEWDGGRKKEERREQLQRPSGADSLHRK